MSITRCWVLRRSCTAGFCTELFVEKITLMTTARVKLYYLFDLVRMSKNIDSNINSHLKWGSNSYLEKTPHCWTRVRPVSSYVPVTTVVFEVDGSLGMPPYMKMFM